MDLDCKSFNFFRLNYRDAINVSICSTNLFNLVTEWTKVMSSTWLLMHAFGLWLGSFHWLRRATSRGVVKVCGEQIKLTDLKRNSLDSIGFEQFLHLKCETQSNIYCSNYKFIGVLIKAHSGTLTVKYRGAVFVGECKHPGVLFVYVACKHIRADCLAVIYNNMLRLYTLRLLPYLNIFKYTERTELFHPTALSLSVIWIHKTVAWLTVWRFVW